MDMQKLMPGVLIGGGALVTIYFLSKSKGSPIVSNALIPTATPVQTPSSDPLKVQAFQTLGNVALGTQRLAEQSQSIAAQLQLGQYRLEEQKAVANASLEATKAGQATSLELARIAGTDAYNRLTAQLTDRNYDRQLQQRAFDQTFALAQAGQIQQGMAQLVNGILRAIGGQQQAPRSSGGMSAGGASGGQSGGPTLLRRRFPSIPRPSVGPFTPPFVPGDVYNAPDPFMSGYYGQAPPGPLDYYPADYFSGIPLNDPSYLPMPTKTESEFPVLTSGGGVPYDSYDWSVYDELY